MLGPFWLRFMDKNPGASSGRVVDLNHTRLLIYVIVSGLIKKGGDVLSEEKDLNIQLLF